MALSPSTTWLLLAAALVIAFRLLPRRGSRCHRKRERFDNVSFKGVSNSQAQSTDLQTFRTCATVPQYYPISDPLSIDYHNNVPSLGGSMLDDVRAQLRTVVQQVNLDATPLLHDTKLASTTTSPTLLKVDPLVKLITDNLKRAVRNYHVDLYKVDKIQHEQNSKTGRLAFELQIDLFEPGADAKRIRFRTVPSLAKLLVSAEFVHVRKNDKDDVLKRLSASKPNPGWFLSRLFLTGVRHSGMLWNDGSKPARRKEI